MKHQGCLSFILRGSQSERQGRKRKLTFIKWGFVLDASFDNDPVDGCPILMRVELSGSFNRVLNIERQGHELPFRGPVNDVFTSSYNKDETGGSNSHLDFRRLPIEPKRLIDVR